MKDELITFETAKLAKSKGFDIPTFWLYSSITGLERGYQSNWNSGNTTFSAPTQSLLQRWLREEHKVIAIVDFYNNGEGWEETEYEVKVSEFKHFKTHDSFVGSGFSSYESALEKGLQEALKLV